MSDIFPPVMDMNLVCGAMPFFEIGGSLAVLSPKTIWTFHKLSKDQDEGNGKGSSCLNPGMGNSSAEIIMEPGFIRRALFAISSVNFLGNSRLSVKTMSASEK